MSSLKKSFSEIASILVGMNNPDDIFNFCRDLMTEDEMCEFLARFEIAKLLDKGVSYSKIEKKTGASSTTIARVSHWLHHGMGGYQHVLAAQKKF